MIYFYDYHIKLWTVFEVDQNDFKIGDVEYFNDRQQMLKQYPQFYFNEHKKHYGI